MFANRFRSIRARLGLLTGVVAVASLATGLYAWFTLSAAKVNGPAYQRIVERKDLIADILPPPLYAIEAYQIVGMLDPSEPADVFAAKARRYGKLKEEFNARIEFWKANLADGPLKK